MKQIEQQKKVISILLKHYTKIGYKGGIAKVIFDDDFENIAEEIVKLFAKSDVINRRELIDNFYAWLDGLTQHEYDDMSLTDKCEKFFFKT